jgi:hypothetical protein
MWQAIQRMTSSVQTMTSTGHVAGRTGDTWQVVQVMTSAVRMMTSTGHVAGHTGDTWQGRTGDDVSSMDDDVSRTRGRPYR